MCVSVISNNINIYVLINIRLANGYNQLTLDHLIYITNQI